MQQPAIDRVARALSGPRSRRAALVAAAVFVGAGRRFSAGQRKKKRRKSGAGTGFSRDCQHFVITAGPGRNDRLRHTDDDLFMELIPKGRGRKRKVIFNDDNDAPNGPDGSHLRVGRFAARVGDRIHIVARNEVPGGCELDEIWLHCTEGRGGRVKLTDRITPEECESDEDDIGVFFDETVRLRNK